MLPFKKKISLLCRALISLENISDQIINIFRELLETEGYTLEDLEYTKGIETRTVGYYMNEHQEQTAYFKGIKIRVSKEKTLSKKLN